MKLTIPLYFFLNLVYNEIIIIIIIIIIMTEKKKKIISNKIFLKEMEYYTCSWYKIKIVSLADFYEINIALTTT